MTPEAWHALPPREREAIGRAITEQRLESYTSRSPKPRSDFQRGLIFWAAGDVYRLLRCVLGMGLLCGLIFLLLGILLFLS